MDQGWRGFAETRDHLREIGLLCVGTGDVAQAGWQPVITEAHGIKVGWLGMTRWLNGNRNPDSDNQPHVNFFPYPGEANETPGKDEAGVLAAIKAARAQCDLLVISVHWGIEYATRPRPEDVVLAHKMLDAGASVIVGHHPHVLQSIETYITIDGRHTIIFYSLGNFLSNQSRTYVDGLMPDRNGDPRDSIIGLFSVIRRDYGAGGVRVDIGHVGILPVWGENNRNALNSGRSKLPDIRPLLIDREIPKLLARLDELNQIANQNELQKSNKTFGANSSVPSPSGLNPDQKKEFVDLMDHLKLLTHRREKILARTGDEYLIAPPKLAMK